MKSVNTVCTSTVMVARWSRLKSRIVSLYSRNWLVIAPMLFVAFGLLGVNEEAWATWPTYSGTITKSGSTYYVLNASNEESVFQTGSHPYDLAGPGAKLTFDAKCTLAAVQNLQVYDGNSVIFDEYVGKYRYVFPAGTMDYVSYGGDGSIVVDAQATQVTFRGAPAATLSRYFKNVKVAMFSGVLQPLFLPSNSAAKSWTYTAADYAAADSYKDFTVDWSNLASLPLSKAVNGSSDDRSQFSYTIQSNTQTLGGGKYGTATIRVKYKHDKVGTHSVKINVGDYSITFTGTTNKITPYIVTTPTVDTITYGQTIGNSQLHGGVVKADLINNTGATVAGTWTIDEAGNTVSTSGGQNTTVNLTFTPSDQNTYNVLHTTQTMFVRSAATITWASAYSAEKPTIPVGKTIENAASTNANGATVTYSTPNTDIIAIENEGTTFRAIAEGEATITASHGVTATHGSASTSKTFKTTYKDIQVIVWTDRFDRLTTEMTSKNLLAQVWIENPVSGDRTYSAARTALLEYSVEDNTVVSIPENSTTLTIHKKGNTTITASVEGDDQYEEASVTMEVKVREPSAGCDDPLLLDIKNNGTNDYLYRFFQMNTNEIIGDEYAINVAQGQVPDKLSFGHKGEYYKPVSIIGSWTYFKGPIKAQQKVDGNWIDVPNSSVTPTVADWKELGDLQLDEKATHIRFVRPQGGEGYHYVRNVEVTMKHFIRTATPTVDFGNAIKVNSSEYRDVVINYSNVKDALKVVNPFISDVTVSDEVIDVDSCGAFGSATLRISFSPTTATEIDDYIVVKDPIVGNSSALSIRVKADVQRADQTITWNPATSISTIDQILLNGTTNGQEYGQMNVIGYEVTNNDGVISVTNNVVTILNPGTVTITASQPGTANYDVAEPVEKNFTISAEPLTLVAPTAQDITYGQALSESTLTGGSAKDSKNNTVYGTFAWETASTIPNASDEAQAFAVVFTPSENAAWYTNLTTTANINVAKADPAATVENVSFAYGTKAEEVALDGTGDGEWSWTDSRKDDVLAAGEYEMDVHFAPIDDANYNAIDTKITLTVNKANPAATVENVSFAYGTKAEDVALDGTGDGEWSWTDSRKGQTLTVGEYEMDVHFTPTDDANYNAIDTKITLTVTKANPVATVENVSFAYGTKAEDVALSGTGAGTWTWTDSRKDDVLAAGEYEMDVHFAPTDGDNYNAIDTKITLTVNKIETLQVPVVLSFCAGGSEEYRGVTYTEAGTYPVNATGANRDTVYNVIVTVLQPTTGTDSKTITYGENESWHGTNLSGYTAGEHEVEYYTTNAVGCDSTVTLSLTVNKATPTLSWETAPAELAYNATDVVYAATSTSNEGDITYSITSGSEYAEINATTGELTNIVPGHNITIQATQAVSTNYNAPVAITVNVTIAAIPTNTFTNAHGDNDWQNDENWSNGVPTGEAPNVIVSGALSINESITVGNLTIENTGSIAVITGGTLTVKGTSEYREAGYGDVHVLNDGAIHLGSSADLQVRDFTLDAKLGDADNAAASGQVSGDDKLNVNGDAYFKMSFDVTGQITYGWYDFVVPFEVDAMNGVFDANGVKIVYGTDYIIMNHSEEKRARNQKAWNTYTGTLEPGRIYTITFEETKTWNTFLFKKKAGSDLVNSGTYTSDYSSTIGESQDRGWNGFGNGTLQHRELTDLTGISKVQMYNHTLNRYDAIDEPDWNNTALAVGTAFSIQVQGEKSIVLETADAEKPLRAPSMEARTVDEFYLTLTDSETEKIADRLWVSANEEATGEYVIGHDLLKMGTPTQAKTAQMWTTRDNMNLCDIEMPLVANTASTNLSFFAPKAGMYEITIQRAPENTMLYLTYNGRAIWNLTYSPYALDLTKGTTEGYGVKMYVQQVTTDIENGELLNGENGVRKVLIDDVIYIIAPDGKMYDITGKSVNY